MNETPQPLDEVIRRRLQAQAVEGTAPELALRRALHASGLRYRVGYPVPGLPRRTIDIAFTGKKLAVFIDGCFWHGCPEHFVPPKNNADWWHNKIQKNIERDAETTDHLEDLGWRVIRFWEHVALAAALDEVTRQLRMKT